MEFDEYEYLEKTVETAAANGDGAKAENKDEKDSGRSSKRRTDEDGHRSEHRSKRSRGDDDDRNREERDRSERGDRERSRHHRDRDRSRYDRERSRGERESERDRADKDLRERDKDRRKEDRERSLEKDKDRERDRDRRRSRDREREHKEKSKEREVPKDRDKDKEKEFRRSRERRDKREEPAPPEPEADPERDQRTVFAWQICLKADEKDVYDFFSKAGKVRDVRLIMDRNSRRSKGVGYIEFYDAMSVPIAIAMSGQLLHGQAVMVKPSEAEKNLAHSANSGSAAGGGYNGPYSGGARRLYVGNLHVNITEEQLRQVFEPFGPIELVQLPLDQETGLCKGYGFVQYQKLEDARCAQLALNGVLELAGRPIKVSAVSDQQTGQDMVTQGDLDDDEGGGLALNARSRALLMQKLDRSGAAPGMIQPAAPAPLAVLGGAITPSLVPNPLLMTGGMQIGLQNAPVEEPIGAPSECLLLKNMFDPNTETEPDFDLDIKDDVQEECSKFGAVKHIYVEKNSAGHVYVRFGAATFAIAAQQALHKRWFAGKIILATFMTVQAYEAKFPESKYATA